MLCEAGDYDGQYIHVDEAVQDADGNWLYQGDATKIDGEWVDNDYVDTCHITGDDIDTRKAVAIEIGQKRSYYGTPFAKLIYVGAESWTADLIRENFVRCGDLLLPRGYYGHDITYGFVPSNIVYGDDYDGDSFADMFVEELVEAA